MPIFGLFAVFIIFCGLTHLIEATIFWHPWYRLSGLVKAVTAVVSWMTVVALVKIIPQALTLPGLAKMNRQLREEIAERESAQQARIKSEERLLFVAECAQVGYWHWDLQSNHWEASDQCKTLYGLPAPDPMTYEAFLAALHPDDRSHTERSISQCLEHERHKEFDAEYCTQRPDGTVRWIHAKGSAAYQNGTAVTLAGIALDITERRKFEEAFRDVLGNAMVPLYPRCTGVGPGCRSQGGSGRVS